MNSENFKPNKLPSKITKLTSHLNDPSRRGSWSIAKDLPTSFKYASQGLRYAFKTQRNFRLHIFIGILVGTIGMWLALPVHNLAILVLTIAAVLVLELINTAIEAVVDLSIGSRFHPLAQISKDCAAAAVLVASLSSMIVALLILLPPLLLRLGI
tara:strand:- start:215 stop:679 length:465 start_codon:yes stop_codon:yes gene_type:complete